MDVFEFVRNLASDYTLRTVALGSGMLGIVSGTLGAFAVLRRQSLLGDAMSHAALPGIAIAFIVTGSKSSLVLLIGAALAGWLGTYFIANVVGLSRIKYDSALGIVLSVFFGFGLVLLTYIQKMPNAAQAGLDTFLFGQAATLLQRDVYIMSAIGLATIIGVVILFKEFKLLSFDPEYGKSVGYPIRRLDAILTALLVVAIVLGLQTVGVVLMSAMIVAPAAAARQWTQRLGVMVMLSALFGCVAGITGSVFSSSMANMPTGPSIVVVISLIVLFSILIAPERGILSNLVSRYRSGKRLRLDLTLSNLHALAMQHDDPYHSHETSSIRTMAPSDYGVENTLEELCEQGLAECSERGRWSLTERGFERAERLLKSRGGEVAR